MIQQFTNHLGEAITNHLGTVIEFEHSNWLYIEGAIDIDFIGQGTITKEIQLASNIDYNIPVSGRIFSEKYITSGINYVVTQQGFISREIKLNDYSDVDLIFKNHLGESITNHNGEMIYFHPHSGIDISLSASAVLSLFKLLNGSIDFSTSISGALALHKMTIGNISYAYTFNGNLFKEGNLIGEILSTNEIQAIIRRYRNLESNINYSAELDAALIKRIGFFDTIIIKFKE